MAMRRVLVALVAAGVVAGVAQPVLADNPIVTDIYTADPGALVHDGRLYLFTGRDEAAPGQQAFVMREWHAFSSADPAPDPAAWQHHGALLSIADFAWADGNAWASEVKQGPDGRFYWFVSIRRATAPAGLDRMSIGVAVADHPLGPYQDAIGGPLLTAEMPNSSAHNIDPTVIVDTQHGIYLYWGSFWSPRFVRLKPSMVELDSPIMTPNGLAEFWEAPWIFQRNGTYYLAYASNANIGGDGCVTASIWACIRYATADSPLGPWTHRGIVLDQVSSTTNHPAIVEFPAGSDEWWMVYHTADAPDGGNFRRSVAIDRLFFNPDGTMQKVVQTPERVEPDPEPTDNVALFGIASASYTSPWETVTALNDGIDPPRSSDGLNPRWGTWPQAGEHWVRLDWSLPVRVTGSDMYFFQDSVDGDGVGVKRPETWTIQYWDGAGWAQVPQPSGYGTALDAYNPTSFAPVTTTALRAVLQTRADADGVGVLEWKVYAVQPDRITPVHAITPVGEPPPLPETVELVYADGSTLAGSVALWQRFDPALLEQPGSFTITGVVAGSLRLAEATVHVCGPEDTCLDGAASGPVTVAPGELLVALDARVAGSVSAARAGEVWLVGSEVGGSVSVVGSTGPVFISGTEVDGGLSLLNNRTGEGTIVVSGNTVEGPLVCLGNQPAPTNQGVPNTVTGSVVGQCR
jgi:hypothetical protein